MTILSAITSLSNPMKGSSKSNISIGKSSSSMSSNNIQCGECDGPTYYYYEYSYPVTTYQVSDYTGGAGSSNGNGSDGGYCGCN